MCGGGPGAPCKVAFAGGGPLDGLTVPEFPADPAGGPVESVFEDEHSPASPAYRLSHRRVDGTWVYTYAGRQAQPRADAA